MAERGYFEYKYGDRVSMPEGITVIDIDSYAPYYNGDEDNTLFRVYIPDSVTRIESQAFKENRSLVAVLFGEYSRLKYIGSTAFYRCESLEKFDFAKLEWLELIGTWAFYDTGLKNVDLSNCLLDFVGVYAFAFNKKLLSVSWVRWGRISHPHIYTVPHYCFYNCINLRNFYGDNYYMTDQDEEEYLEYIGFGAFKGCDSIEEFNVRPECKVGKNNEPIEKFINNQN